MEHGKFIKQTTLGSGALFIFSNIIKQLNLMHQNKDVKFDYSQSIEVGLKGLCTGFGISATIVGLCKLFGPKELDKEDIDELNYLENTLASYDLDKTDKESIKKGVILKKKLEKKFKDKLEGRPKYQGSYSQGTALSGLSDLDILMLFKSEGYKTLEQMYFDTLEYFENDFLDEALIGVRAQKRSIGLTFKIDNEEISIDIVPARKIKSSKKHGDYQLYENKSGLFKRASRHKMNPTIQANLGEHSKSKADVIRLIKLLNYQEELPLNSIMIKELTKEAFRKQNQFIPRRLNDQLIMTMEYIRDNIERKVISSPDNTNNIISNSLSSRDKLKIANSFESIIAELNHSSRNWEYYFINRNV